jgi:hypothetical protein
MSATALRPRRLLLCMLVITTIATAALAATVSASATPTSFYEQSSST